MLYYTCDRTGAILRRVFRTMSLALYYTIFVTDLAPFCVELSGLYLWHQVIPYLVIDPALCCVLFGIVSLTPCYTISGDKPSTMLCGGQTFIPGPILHCTWCQFVSLVPCYTILSRKSAHYVPCYILLEVRILSLASCAPFIRLEFCVLVPWYTIPNVL